MRMRGILALGLAAFAVVMHTGCDAPRCPAGSVGPYDNRDRKNFPSRDQDWVCVIVPEPVAPPPPPDLGGFKPPDPPGPRDRDAVAKAAIFVESCTRTFYTDPERVNAHIDATYSAISSQPVVQAILERVDCFKDKTNGCEAVRECLGIVKTTSDSGFAPGCVADGVGMEALSSSYKWVNCAGLGFECHTNSGFFCSPPRSPCDLEFDVPHCTVDGVPRNCTTSYKGGPPLRYEEESCAKYGLKCYANEERAYCAGDGPACTESFWDFSSNFLADFRAGIACENATTLRACVRGHEQLVDCTAQGEGFGCIGGSRPRCGYDFQCAQVDPTHVSEIHFLTPSCDGTSITVCNSGVWTTIDCKSLGFEGCDPVKGVCKPKPLEKTP